MGLETAFEVGRLYQPLMSLANARRDVHSAFALLPGLRGFWPMSASADNGSAIDQSGHNQILVAAGTPLYGGTNAPYVTLNGTTDYLYGADNPLYDVTGTETYTEASLRGLTVGGWFWTTKTATQGLMSKWTAAGNQRMFTVTNNGFTVSSDGIVWQSASFPSAMTINTWHFVVGRASASSVDAFDNGNKYSGPAAFPIFNSSAQLWLGRYITSLYLDGRMSMAFYCASALPDSVLDNLFQTSRSLFGV